MVENEGDGQKIWFQGFLTATPVHPRGLTFQQDLSLCYLGDLRQLSDATQGHLKGMSRESHQAGTRTEVPMQADRPYV